jgi:hypothetical protein
MRVSLLSSWYRTWNVVSIMGAGMLIISLDIQGSIAAAYRTVVDIRIGLVRWIDWTRTKGIHIHDY